MVTLRLKPTKSSHGFTVLFLAFCSWGARADTDAQSWMQFLSQGKLPSQVRLWTELQPRFGSGVGGLTTLLIRPAIGWQVTDDLSLWGGYAWAPLLKPTSRNEHRAWAQAIYVAQPFGGTFTQRLRMESRFFESASASAFRLRYQARLAIPVALENALSLVVYDEVFLSLNDASPVITSGFDQNRLFVGAFHRFSPQLAIDIGYLWNAVRRPGAPENRTNHVIMLSLFHWFDFSRNAEVP